MSVVSARTLAEMEAGARALALAQGRDPDTTDLLGRIKSVADRHAAMQRWEKSGLLTIERTSETNYQSNRLEHRTLHHVKNGPTFEDTPEALMYGGYPSELLVAQIALAIQACAGGE